MLLSRIWYFLIAAGLALSALASVLTQASLNRQYREALTDQLTRDQGEVELWLALDARSRLDALMVVSSDVQVRTALQQGSAATGKGTTETLRASLTRRLNQLNDEKLAELRGDLLFALNLSGHIVAQVGGKAAPAGASLAALPVVERALRGFVRDDVWLYHGFLYRIAARPVIHAGRYVGAVVHGKRCDSEFAARIGKRLQGATFAMLTADRILGSHQPEQREATPRQMLEDKTAALVKAADAEGLQELGRFEHWQHKARVVRLRGSAGQADTAYLIARPLLQLDSAFAVIEQATAEDAAEAKGRMVWIALLALVLGLAGLAFVYLERDRPLRRLQTAVSDLAEHGKAFEVHHVGSAYRTLARNIQALLQRERGDADRESTDLNAILGPEPSAEDSNAASYFQVPGAPAAAPPSTAAPPPAAPTAALPSAAAAPVDPGHKSAAASTQQGSAPAAAKAAPPPPPPGPRRSPVAAVHPAPPPTAALRSSAVPARAGRPSETESMGASRPSQGIPMDEFVEAEGDATLWEDRNETVVSRVPQELLAKASGRSAAIDPSDEAHYRRVFREYIETKRQCGESVENFSYERFLQSLQKNVAKIKSTHGAKRVRFRVYVKHGRAALKATPQRD